MSHQAQNPSDDAGSLEGKNVLGPLREPSIKYTFDDLIVYRCYGTTQFTVQNMRTGATLVLRGGSDVVALSYMHDRTLRADQFPKYRGDDDTSNVFAIVKVEPIDPRRGLDATHNSDLREEGGILMLHSSPTCFTVLDYGVIDDQGRPNGRYLHVVPPAQMMAMSAPDLTVIHSIYLDQDYAQYFDHPDRRR